MRRRCLCKLMFLITSAPIRAAAASSGLDSKPRRRDARTEAPTPRSDDARRSRSGVRERRERAPPCRRRARGPPPRRPPVGDGRLCGARGVRGGASAAAGRAGGGDEASRARNSSRIDRASSRRDATRRSTSPPLTARRRRRRRRRVLARRRRLGAEVRPQPVADAAPGARRRATGRRRRGRRALREPPRRAEDVVGARQEPRRRGGDVAAQRLLDRPRRLVHEAALAVDRVQRRRRARVLVGVVARGQQLRAARFVVPVDER